MRSRLRARSWTPVLLVVLTLGVLGLVAGAATVGVPLVERDVPVRVLLGSGVVLALLVPLQNPFGELSRTFVREPRVRVLRVVAVLGLAVAGCVPPFLVAWDGWQARADAVLLALLLALGLVAVVLVGDRAWLPVVAVVTTVLIVDGGPGAVISAVLVRIPPLVPALVLAAAAALAAVVPPRSTT